MKAFSQTRLPGVGAGHSSPLSASVGGGSADPGGCYRTIPAPFTFTPSSSLQEPPASSSAGGSCHFPLQHETSWAPVEQTRQAQLHGVLAPELPSWPPPPLWCHWYHETGDWGRALPLKQGSLMSLSCLVLTFHHLPTVCLGVLKVKFIPSFHHLLVTEAIS